MKRVQFIRTVIARPLGKTVTTLLALLGTAATIRELFLPEPVQIKLNFYRLWTLHWPWWLWAIVVAVGAVLILFEGAFAGIRERETTIATLREIVDAAKPHVFIGYEHVRRAPDPLYGIDEAAPFFLKNDGQTTAMNIRVSRGVIDGGKIVTFSPMATQLGPGETTTMVMYSGDRIDRRLDREFAQILHERLAGGETTNVHVSLPVRIEFSDLRGTQYSAAYDIAVSVFPRGDGSFQMENLRIEVK